MLSARSNASQNIGPNNAYEQAEKSKQPEVPLTSPDPEPMKNIEIVQENVQNQPPQFYEKQKEEYENIKDEEYDIEKVEYYQEESVHEDESRPMNTEYMNPNEDKRSYQNDYQQFNEEFSRDAIELNNEGNTLSLFLSLPIYFLLILKISLFLDYEHKPEEYGQERKDTESYPMNAKTGLQSSKMMTNNDIGHEGDHEGDHEIENDIDNEIDQEIEELNLFK